MTERIAVVTGATGGMGREIVADLARDHTVYALGRELDRLASHPAVIPVATDLTALLRGETIPELAELGRVDVLVHGAAIARRFSVESAQPEDWEAQMSLNVFVPAELTRQLLPAVRVAEGLVVFINSGAGKKSYGDNVVYAATKHALYALADGLRLSEPTIRVTTVAPGPTDTPMLQGLQSYDPAEVIAPVEVARALRAAVAAGPSTQLTDISVRPRVELARRGRPRVELARRG